MKRRTRVSIDIHKVGRIAGIARIRGRGQLSTCSGGAVAGRGDEPLNRRIDCEKVVRVVSCTRHDGLVRVEDAVDVPRILLRVARELWCGSMLANRGIDVEKIIGIASTLLILRGSSLLQWLIYPREVMGIAKIGRAHV